MDGEGGAEVAGCHHRQREYQALEPPLLRVKPGSARGAQPGRGVLWCFRDLCHNSGRIDARRKEPT